MNKKIRISASEKLIVLDRRLDKTESFSVEIEYLLRKRNIHQ